MKRNDFACRWKPVLSCLLCFWSFALVPVSVLVLPSRAGAQPAAPPVLNSFTPASGPIGTKVALQGDSLGGVTAVKFNGVAASFTVFDANELIAVVPSGAGTGPITVAGPGGSSVSAGTFTVTATPPPDIIRFEPASGPVGTEVTIRGQNLAGATAVLFNGVSASFHEGFAGEALVALVPAGAQTGPISVVTPFGTAQTPGNFTVTTVIPPPLVSGISPLRGPVGSSVVISGENLATATAVRFNGVNATFSVFGSTLIAEVPATATAGPITVTTPGGSSTSGTPFGVTVVGAPLIYTMTPLSGRPGARVTISGENLAETTTVRFNGVTAVFTLFGSSLVATVPDAATSGPVTVTTPRGTDTSLDTFQVLSPTAPEITGFTPSSGAIGTIITVQGINFVDVTDVRVGGVSAPFNVASPTQLTALVPDGATSGSVSVVTPAGTASSSDNFLVPATIVSFEPTLGKPGTVVTIRGLNFDGVIAVLFSGVSGSFTNVSSTELLAVVPEDAQTGSITVATPAGFGTSTSNFLLPPKIIDFDPSGGLPGSTVTIKGENLLGATSVEIGGVQAPATVLSLTTLIATVPQQAQNGPITVVTPAGSVTSIKSFLVGVFTDVEVAVSTFPETVSMGDFVRYDITVTNRGPVDAINVVLIDRLPAGIQLLFAPSGGDCVETNDTIRCNLGILARGLGASIRISGNVLAGPYLTNQVDVAMAGGDPDLSNNSVTLITPVGDAPPLPSNVSLAAAVSGKSLTLSWNASGSNFVLETAASLVPPVTWTPVPGSPVTIDGRKTVTQSMTADTRFYRLKKP